MSVYLDIYLYKTYTRSLKGLDLKYSKIQITCIRKFKTFKTTFG